MARCILSVGECDGCMECYDEFENEESPCEEVSDDLEENYGRAYL